MSTPAFSRLAIAACATAITAITTAGFVKSTASTERDPFNFGAVMAANAQVHSEQLLSRYASLTCSGSLEEDRAEMCWS